MVWSIISPVLDFRRYFLSQMSSDASRITSYNVCYTKLLRSLDIWDKKYRLKSKTGEIIDQTIDDTYKRVARALADVEDEAAQREQWYESFLWALRRGAIPAGRIISNAGAQEHKPATSTINCTVSGSYNFV